jgi:AbrB family looped-hinge helix DNA binding protein
MNTVTISPKFQVVIPLSVRKAFHISPGEKLQVVPFENRIELIPFRKLKKARGFLRGMNTTIRREKDRI